jgi:hypothetical protein
MAFTACAQLFLPKVAEAFTHLGFPDYFRVELSWARLLGVVLLLAPVPARLKEWGRAAATGVLWGSRTFSGAACRPRRRAPDRTSGSRPRPVPHQTYLLTRPQYSS